MPRTVRTAEYAPLPQLADYARPHVHLASVDPESTMRWMARETQIAQQDTSLRLFAEKLVVGVFPHDYLSEYAAVLNWVRLHIRYTRDPVTIEQVKTPAAVLETESGDCDDLSTCIGSLLGTLGAKIRYVAGAFAHDADGQPALTHVWCEAWEPNIKAWVVLDPVPGRRVGQMLNKLISAKMIMALE